MTLLVDTGVWLSAADADEPRHADSADLVRRHRGELIAPAPVVAETAWLIEARLGPAHEARFLRLVTAGELRVVALAIADYQRCIDLIDRYADLSLGLVDASLVAVEAWGCSPSEAAGAGSCRLSTPRRARRERPVLPRCPQPRWPRSIGRRHQGRPSWWPRQPMPATSRHDG